MNPENESTNHGFQESASPFGRFREFRGISQEKGGGRRRWFESEGLDLVVWYDDGSTLSGFQLIHGHGSHALTWRPKTGFQHHGIDSGRRAGGMAQTPILVANGVVPWDQLVEEFSFRSKNMESDLRELILSRLKERS